MITARVEPNTHVLQLVVLGAAVAAAALLAG